MNNKTRNILTVLLLVLSVTMIVMGVLIGEPSVVFKKAANVCMECIGIG